MMASRESSQDRRRQRQQLCASPQGGSSLEELLLAGDVAHNSRGAQRSRVPQPLPAALNRSPALPSESSQPWSSPTRQASFSPALDECPRADPRLVAGSHPAPLRSSPVGRDECKGPAGVSAQAASCTEPPATYRGEQTMNPSAPRSETSAQHVLTMPGRQAQPLHPCPSPKPSPGGARRPSSPLAQGSSHTSKGREFTGEKQGSAGRSELQRLTSLCSASLCNSLQFLASLQFLQPLFTSSQRRAGDSPAAAAPQP